MSLTRTTIIILCSVLIGRTKLQLKKKRMTKLCNKNRRESTMVRDNEIHELYQQIRHELGDLANVVSKGYIYERIKEKTKLSIRTISFILNHTKAG